MNNISFFPQSTTHILCFYYPPWLEQNIKTINFWSVLVAQCQPPSWCSSTWSCLMRFDFSSVFRDRICQQCLHQTSLSKCPRLICHTLRLIVPSSVILYSSWHFRLHLTHNNGMLFPWMPWKWNIDWATKESFIWLRLWALTSKVCRLNLMVGK